MAQPFVSRIYDLKIEGYDESIKKVDALTEAFNQMDAAKKKLNAELSQKVEISDTAGIAALTAKIKELETEMEKLKAKRDAAAKEAEKQSKAQKSGLEDEKKSVDLLTASYTALKAERKELEAIHANTDKDQPINFKGNELNYDEAIARINELKEAERQYLEQFRKLKEERSKPIENIPFTSNLEQLKEEQIELEKTGTVISEFDKKEAEAAISAKEFGDSQKQVTDSVKGQEETFSGVIGTFDEYTARLRENIKIQIENSQAIAANKEQQLEIEKSIKATGVATDAQIEKLAALKEEALLLKEQNKQLDQTTRNQAKEYLAVTGSLEELQAQLNLLRQAYGKLTDMERQSPFGQALKAQIDAIEPEVQRLENSMGQFNRKVGDYTGGILEAFKKFGLSDVLKKQRDDINNTLNELKTQNASLAEQYRQLALKGGSAFEKISQELREGIILQEKYEQSLHNISATLENTGSISYRVTQGMSQGFNRLKTDVGQLLMGYVGFQAVFSGLRSGVGIAKELSDGVTNLEIELGKAKGGASALVDELSKINTRTKLTELVDMGFIATKAGVGEDKLVKVVESIDKIKVAFGKDFGDVEKGTEDLIKLTTIFYGKENVTGDTLTKIGNGIRVLANESVASVPYITDFAQRMVGLNGIFDISLSASIGMAAGFEQLGISSEVASTALVKILPKIASDTEKFSKIAGMTKQAFSDLLNNNPEEALLKVAQGLREGKTTVEEFSKSFTESELGDGRIKTVLGALSKNTDLFRDSITSAAKATQDTSNITDAFTAKNENLAATMDKLAKKFSDAANSKGFQIAITVIASGVSFLVGNIGVLIGLLSLFGIGWAFASKEIIVAGVATQTTNGALLLQRAALIGNNIVLGLQTIAIKAANIAMMAYYGAIALFTGGLTKATIATNLFSNATRLVPLGAILTLLGLIIGAMKVFGAALNGTTKELNALARQQIINDEITRKANATVVDQISKIDSWKKVIESAASSPETMKMALQKLIDINPAFRAALDGQIVDLNKLNEAYTKVVEGINAKARAEVAADLSATKYKDVLRIQTIQQQTEIDAAKKPGVQTIEGLTDEEIDKILSKINLKTSTIRAAGNGKITFDTKDIEQVKKQLEQIGKEKVDIYTDYLKVQGDADTKLEEIEKAAKENLKKNAETISKGFEIDITYLKSQIEDLDKQIAAFQGAQKDLNKLIADRKALQDKLDAAMGKEKSTNYKGDRLTGDENNELKLIEAERDEQITAEKLKFAKKQELRKINILEEIKFLRDLQRINDEADRKKIAAIKGNNAAEVKLRSELELAIIARRIETNDKIQAINEREFKEESNVYKKRLERIKAAIQLEYETINNNPNVQSEDKAIAKKNADQKLIEQTLLYYNTIETIAKKYRINAEAIEEEKQKTLTEIIKGGLNNERDIVEGKLKDIEEAYEKSVVEIKNKFAKYREKVNNDQSLTESQKQYQLEQLRLEENNELLIAKKSKFYLRLEEIRKAFENGEIKSLKDLQKAQTDYLEAFEDWQKELKNRANSDPLGITKIGKDLTALGKQISEMAGVSGVWGDMIVKGFELAKDAMNAYFDAERNRIQQSKQHALDRLDIEREQVKGKAQSKAEESSIDKQYAAKRIAIEKEAGEKLKQAKKAEAKVSLATELANIAASAAANVMNGATFGVAGIIQYGILSAMALARYAMNVSAISSAAFEYGGSLKDFFIKKKTSVHAFGGNPDTSTTRGGKVKGRPHSQGGNPFIFKGRVFEDEVDELNIIRTKNAPKGIKYNISGTQEEIASALNEIGGGVRFRPGATLKKLAYGGSLSRFDYGGYMGENLKPPYNPSSFLSSQNTDGLKQIIADNNKQVKEMISNQSANIEAANRQVNNRIDRLKVQVVAQEVDTTNNNIKKASSMGSL